MVTSSPITAQVSFNQHSTQVDLWEVIPTNTTPANPDVTAKVKISWWDNEFKIRRGVYNMPVVVHVTKPDGTTFDTAQTFTDVDGVATVVITLDALGVWTFVAEGFTFNDGLSDEWLGCEKPLAVNRQVSVARVIGGAIVGLLLGVLFGKI